MDLVDSRDYRAGPDIRAAAKTHDRVLVDCPGAASSLLDSAIRESGLVIVPCQPSVMDAWASSSVIEAAARLRTPACILLNRVPPRASGHDEVLSALGPARDSLLAASLGNRVGFSQAMISGRTASEIARRSPAAAEIAALVTEIDGILATI
jgi:chromosome partitioning protein